MEKLFCRGGSKPPPYITELFNFRRKIEILLR